MAGKGLKWKKFEKLAIPWKMSCEKIPLTMYPPKKQLYAWYRPWNRPKPEKCGLNHLLQWDSHSISIFINRYQLSLHERISPTASLNCVVCMYTLTCNFLHHTEPNSHGREVFAHSPSLNCAVCTHWPSNFPHRTEPNSHGCGRIHPQRSSSFVGGYTHTRENSAPSVCREN